MLLKYQPEKYLWKQLNIRNYQKQTPLITTCCSMYSNAYGSCLLDYKSQLNLNAIDIWEETPLHKVVRSMIELDFETHGGFMERLLQAPSVVIHRTNNEGKTPLDILTCTLAKKEWLRDRTVLEEAVRLLEHYRTKSLF
jgi:hypothetical protein